MADQTSQCVNNVSGCQQLCLPLGRGQEYVCACNDQAELANDTKSCRLGQSDELVAISVMSLISNINIKQPQCAEKVRSMT